jgi:hypothetical protein
MKKQRLHQYFLGAVVGFSMLSFAYVNFFAGSDELPIGNSVLIGTSGPSTAIDKDDVDNEKGSAPDIAVLVRVFDFAKKFVPSGR